MISPSVSIIIPVYNKAAFVRESIESALGQSYPNIEVVLVNDGSTDGSMAILEEFKASYPNKIVLIDQKNGGVSQATNAGIAASKGDFIQFLDADDLMAPEKIKKQLKHLEVKPKDGIATCKWATFEKNFDKTVEFDLGLYRDFSNGIDFLVQAWDSSEMMAISSYLTPRDLILKAGPWDESLTINQDGEFFCRVLLCSKGIFFEPKGKVFYRKPGASNVSQQKSYKAASSLLESYRCYEREILKVEDSKRVREAIAKNYLRFSYVIYPNYPDLLEASFREFDRMGVDRSVKIGGPKFQLMTKLLGYKNALKLKRFFQ
jgi:glycosyltransferase involved in cell wall biosynthesis